MLNFRSVAYRRGYQCKVDADSALVLRRQGKSLRAIRDAISPGASLTSVHRAIRRAETAQASEAA